MLISIIIPVYNVENYIIQCINSVIEQDYRNLEIILINDGSTDSSGEICEKFSKKDNRIKVIYQENGGLSNARNSGIKIAKGEYIWFIDSDDWIEKNVLSKLVNELEDSTVEMLEFSLKMYIEETNKFELSIHPEKIITTKNGKNFIIENNRIAPQAWIYLYKKEFLSSNNFLFKDKLIHEDEPFNWQCLFKVNKIKKISVIAYNYRIRKNSIITGTVTQNKIESYLYLLHFFSDYKKLKFLDDYLIEKRIFNYINLLNSSLDKSDFNFLSKIKYLNKLKNTIPKQEIYKSDRIIQKIEKKIYNFNIYVYYCYKLLRKIR